jgi:hypothetical protein
MRGVRRHSRERCKVKDEFFWALAGIVLGWALTTISSFLDARRFKRQAIGQLLTKLIRVHRQIGTMRQACEHMHDHAGDCEGYERIRRGIVDRHFMEPQSVREDLKTAIDAIAGLRPLLAIELENTYEMLLRNKSADLTVSSKSPELYARMLTTYEVALDVVDKQLAANLRSLASSHGIATRLRYELSQYRRRKSKARNQAFANKWAGEIGAAAKTLSDNLEESGITTKTKNGA